MLHFIVNPNTSGGMGEKYWSKIKSILDDRNINYEYSLTSLEKNGEKIAAELTCNLNKPLTLVILGGDGSLNEVINGIENYSFVTLGILPLGSGNDFVRSFGKKLSMEEYLNMILNPKNIVEYNIGKMKNSKKERKFIVSSGIGFDAHITHNVNNSNFRKIFKNTPIVKLVYIFSAFKSLFQYKPLKYTVYEYNKKTVFNNGYYCIVMNTPYEGKGVKFCPDAIGNDNILDFCFINSKYKIKIVFLTLLAFLGKHIHFKSTYICTGNYFRIEIEGNTYSHRDGEDGGLTNWAEYSLLDKKVNIIVG